MARPNAVPMYRYINFLFEKVEKGETEAAKVNPNMLVSLGGTRVRREEAVEKFKSVFVDEDGKLVGVPLEVTNWIEDMSEKLLEVQMLALSSAKFETARQLLNTKEKLAEKSALLTESSENLAETLSFLEEANNSLESISEELKGVKEELSESTKKILGLESSNEKLHSDISLLESELRTERAKNESLEHKVSTYQQSAERSIADAERWERRFETADENLREVQSNLALVRERKTQLEIESSALLSRAETAENEVSKLTEQAREARVSHETELKKVKAEILDVKQNAETRIQNLTDSLGGVQVEKSSLEHAVTELKAKNQVLQDLVVQSDRVIEEKESAS